MIDYVEYDDGLPNTEEDSYINDDESFTEDSESLDLHQLLEGYHGVI